MASMYDLEIDYKIETASVNRSGFFIVFLNGYIQGLRSLIC